MKRFSTTTNVSNIAETSPRASPSPRRATSNVSSAPGTDLSNKLAFTFSESHTDISTDLGVASSPKLRRQVDNNDDSATRRMSVRKNSTSDRISLFENRNKNVKRINTM